MVSVDEASRFVFSKLFKPVRETVPLANALGRTLSEPIRADRPFPPFDRVAMDGIAISFDAWLAGDRSFLIEGTQAAGESRKILAEVKHCIEVMTGAVLPKGTDTVIRYEDVSIQNNRAEIKIDSVQKGQNVHAEGIDVKANEIILSPGQRLSPAEIAVLASVGKSAVSVYSLPKVAVISGGDELVAIEDTPLPHQIRRSNSSALVAAIQRMQCSVSAFHLPDRLEVLQPKIEAMLADFDVLILSGGVSKGKFDFVPQVLEKAGVNKIFHEVSQRPGKPFWFGVNAQGKTVFALPGNPVSTFMCYYKYVEPWLIQSMGGKHIPQYAILDQDFSFQPKLTHFLQVRVTNNEGKLMAIPMAGGGSGDFANLTEVTGFLELPADKTSFLKGEAYPYISFR